MQHRTFIGALPLVLCLTLVGVTLRAEMRVFTDNGGRTIRGELVSIKGDQITLKREDGLVFTLKVATLSPADIDYLKGHGLATAPASSPSGATPASSPGHHENLLTNGSFEKGIEGWTFHADHHAGEMAWDEVERREGKPCLRIQNGGVDESMAQQKITVKPGTHYRLTGYIKTKGLQPEKPKGKYGACLVAGSAKTPAVLGTKSWTRVTIDFDTFHETEIEVGAHLGDFFDRESGTAWYSDLSLVEIGKAKKLAN